jgi:hypothetical protein
VIVQVRTAGGAGAARPVGGSCIEGVGAEGRGFGAFPAGEISGWD